MPQMKSLFPKKHIFFALLFLLNIVLSSSTHPQSDTFLGFKLGQTKVEYRKRIKTLLKQEKLTVIHDNKQAAYSYNFYTNKGKALNGTISPEFDEKDHLIKIEITLQYWEKSEIDNSVSPINYTCQEINEVIQLFKSKYGEPLVEVGDELIWNIGLQKITVSSRPSSISPQCYGTIRYSFSDQAIKEINDKKRNQNLNDI